MSATEKRVLGAKFDERDVKLVQEACHIRGEDQSSFIRRAVKKELLQLGLLDKKEARVLGLGASA